MRSPAFGRLAEAPHRLLFFVGACNVLMAMAWWAAWLAAQRFGMPPMPQPQPWAGWLHAFVMQYQMLPSFMFGFLLTTFPKWMGLPDLPRAAYVPVGLGLFGGQVATLAGALGAPAGIEVGLWMTAGGWLAGLAALGSRLVRDTSGNWHARACFAALSLGFAGLAAWIAFVHGAPPTWAFASIKIGTFGLLLPVYLAVVHRMVPFFASRVVPGYAPWRPMAWLGAMLALCVVHLVLELRHAYAWLWVADLPLMALSVLALWKWWPRGRQPGLLLALFLGLAWLPVTFALYAAQGIVYLATDQFILGRAPAHALFVGFFASLLVAMVTRVVQGHSGRPLVMPAVAWFAFAAVQAVAIARLLAEVLPDAMAWQVASAVGWLVAFLPWVLRIGRIVLAPRVDGKPG
jgi:uncharacterized protein involved in response to NO